MKFTDYVKIREEKFGVVIFDTLTEKVYVTNETAKEIISLLLAGKTEKEIIQILTDSYNGSTQEISDDTINFINELKKRNLLIE